LKPVKQSQTCKKWPHCYYFRFNPNPFLGFGSNLVKFYGLLMDASLISQGLDLMLYGMGTVFTFLTLLVGLTALMSRSVMRFSKEELVESKESDHQIHSALVDKKIVKVIQAAIDQHRGS
jgi:oxaloacetate decarboxylase gamma subunit